MATSSSGHVLAAGGESWKAFDRQVSLADRSCRTEKYPPWDSRCTFYQLRKECQDFRASLPRQHALTTQNTQAHISLKTSTPYTLVHTVFLLAQIMLHREYVPFLPIRSSKPEGPLDPPTFPADKYDVPPGFWRDSARECFKSARDVMDLVRSCQEWNALVETPIIGFAIYTVAFVGVYCINFPWMDPDGYMCTKPTADAHTKGDFVKPGASKGFEAARKALEMIGQMRPRLHMADGWFKTINRIHKYMRKMKSDYRKNTAPNDPSTSESDNSPLSTRHLSLREGGLGGGLEEWKLLERTLKDFGNLEDQDIEMVDGEERLVSRPLDAVYDDSNSGTTVKSEEVDPRGGPAAEHSRPEIGPWNAINAAPGASHRHEETATPHSSQFRTYDSYQRVQQSYQPPQQTSQQQQHQQQPGYAQQINSFRPVYSPHDAPGPGAPPSLTSPASHSATTPSEPSPGFQRQAQQQQQQGYPAWPQSHNPQYQMQPPQSSSYMNGILNPPHDSTPMQAAQAYSTPSHHQQGPAQMQVPQPQPWNPMEKEAWLDSLDTRLGGDDVAAFVDGGDITEWATMSANRGYGGGWLSAVWGGAGQ